MYLKKTQSHLCKVTMPGRAGKEENMEIIKVYRYRIVREDLSTGKQAKRGRISMFYEPLNVGGLYSHIGGKSGLYRVLECISVEEVEL